MEEQSIVTKVDGNGNAWVVPQRAQNCGQCKSESGCGIFTLANFFGEKNARVKVLNPINAKVGDQVLIVIPDQTLLRASLLVYCFPLLCLFAAASLAHVVFGLNDATVIIIGLLGLLAGFACLSLVSSLKSHQSNWQPVIQTVIKSEKLKFTVAGNLN